MSTQACLIKGFGYKFKHDDNIFSYIDNNDDEYDFIDVIGLDGSYYNMRNLKSDETISPLRIFLDGYSGEYKYVLFVTEASYIENTHGDDRWKNKYRNDDYVKKYAKQHIETLIGKKLSDVQEIEFEHWE